MKGIKSYVFLCLSLCLLLIFVGSALLPAAAYSVRGSECTVHTEVIDYGVKATWGTPGKTEGSHCSSCGQILRAQQEIKPIEGYNMNANEYDLLRQLNKARAAAGVVPHTTFDKLQNAAGIRVEEVSNGSDSTRPNGEPWYSALADAGITSYASCAESRTKGYYPALQLVTALMNDENHRSNVLSTTYPHVGVGYTYNASGSHKNYWHRFSYKSHNCSHSNLKIITPEYMSFYPGTDIDQMYLLLTLDCKNCGRVYAPVISEYCSGYDAAKIGKQKVTVSCFGLKATFDVTILSHNHVYSQKLTAATCLAGGYTDFFCPCGYSYRGAYTGLADHSYGSGFVSQEAGCTTTGTKIYTCTLCKASKTETIPAKGHSVVTDPAIPATCTAAGKTEGKHCSVCQAVLIAQSTIPAAGHKEVKDPAVKATCAAPGKTEGKHCASCGEVLVAQQSIAQLAHTPVTDKAVVPTCTTGGKTEGSHCYVCGTIIKAQYPVPAMGHRLTYQDLGAQHSMRCQYCSYSATVAHSFADGYCLCGHGPEIDTKLKLNHTLNLASDISVNFAVQSSLLSGYGIDSVYLVVTVDSYNGNHLTGQQSYRLQPVLNGNYYYFTLDGLTAVQMMDKLQAVLYGVKNGQSYHSATDVYSIAQYAYSQLSKQTAPAVLKTLCADLLRYGSAAQSYKGYRTDAPADSAMTGDQKSYLTSMEQISFGNTNQVLNDQENPTVTWKGKALDLNTRVGIKYIVDLSSFTGNREKLNLRVSYVTLSGVNHVSFVTTLEEYNPDKQLYAFSFYGLSAAELRSVVSVRIYEGSNAVSSTLQYSPDTYGNGKTGALGTLCKALFAYSDSAKEYFS